MTRMAFSTREVPPAARAERSPAAPCEWLGNWQLIGCVGQGEWTSVYRARPAGAQGEQASAYALKTLRAERQDDPLAIEMLAREARVGREARHPHLIAVLEAQLKRAPRFLVMPWLEGAALQAYTGLFTAIHKPEAQAKDGKGLTFACV